MGSNTVKLKLILLAFLGLVEVNFPAKADNLKPAPAGMVLIPGGKYKSFLIEKGNSAQVVKSFYLDVQAVNNGEFLEFVKLHPQWSRSRVSKLFADAGYLRQWTGDFSVAGNLMKSPVTNVSWFAANAYAKWKGKRLPTLNEWEYAGNAPIINDKRPVEKVILDWYSKPAPKVLPAAETGYKNRLNVIGMHGLIWEWVSDFNSIILAGDSRSSPAINRDLFCASGALAAVDKENYAAYMRYAFRGSLKAKYTVANLGFRCARTIN